MTEPLSEPVDTDERESLGRLVHDTRLACEADRAAAEGREKFKLGSWEERDDWQRELDIRIGAAVAAHGAARLEHAEAALAGDNEGIRLWMLDCGELTAKHRARAEAAEAKLAAITDACRSIPTPIAERILAIIGSEEEARDA